MNINSLIVNNTSVTRRIENREVNDRPVVLIIDDDQHILHSFRYLMDSENCEMIDASSSQEALEKIKGKHIDLVITDFMLETKSSIELFTLIRKTNPEVPIVVMTGYPELISSMDVKMFGGNQLLTKPLELSRLRDIIRRYCNPLHVMN